jgi:YidC/Oxa1 family membrane protein insertase
MMDKRTIFALVIIAVIFLVWSLVIVPMQTPPKAKDSIVVKDTAAANAAIRAAQKPTVPAAPKLDSNLAPLAQGSSRYITIQTPLYKAILNTRGGLLARVQLNHYKTWYGAPVQLINDSTGFPGVLALDVKGTDGHVIPTENLIFKVDGPDSIGLKDGDSVTIDAILAFPGKAAHDSTMKPGDSSGAVATGGSIVKRFTFRGDRYGIGLDVALRNMASELAVGSYALSWKGGIKYQEHNSVDESSKAKGIVNVGGDLTDVDASDPAKPRDEKFAGAINWIGANSKYFGAAIIPATISPKSVGEISGSAATADSSGKLETYNIMLGVPSTGNETQHFTVFAGPLDYGVTRTFGIQSMVDLGNRTVIRPIGEYVMLPLFRFLHNFIGNYGLVIIVFSLLIRLILWPLSIPQIRSSRKMQLLQPKIAEIRERFKDDQQRQQMETMTLYREFGINPVSGCLPMILQLPILYALWGVLSSAIDLRQAGFMLWIRDLSIPDQVAHLPFSIPLLGDKLSGLALIMGATLFIQQKMMIIDPKQKAMIYFMPILLTLTFNHLPSGLNLYYLTFNLLSIGQQLYITKYSKNTMTLEDMRKSAKTKKKGWLSQKMEEAQKMAEMQGRTPGGKGGDKKVEGRTAVEPRKRK